MYRYAASRAMSEVSNNRFKLLAACPEPAQGRQRSTKRRSRREKRGAVVARGLARWWAI